MGIVSIIFSSRSCLLTCPKESDFKLYLEDKYSMSVTKWILVARRNVDQKEEKIQFVSMDARNGVFLITIKQTFQTEAE